jgi:aminomethyltransferase
MRILGITTSGIPSPTLGTSIAMGYINTDGPVTDKALIGKEVQVVIRNQPKKWAIEAMPFVKVGYHRK